MAGDSAVADSDNHKVLRGIVLGGAEREIVFEIIIRQRLATTQKVVFFVLNVNFSCHDN